MIEGDVQPEDVQAGQRPEDQQEANTFVRFWLGFSQHVLKEGPHMPDPVEGPHKARMVVQGLLLEQAHEGDVRPFAEA